MSPRGSHDFGYACKILSLLCAHQGCIYLIENAVKTVILWTIFQQLFSSLPYFKILIIPVMQSWIFSIITPDFSVTRSFRNHSNMLIWLLMLKSIVLLVLLHLFQDSLIILFKIFYVINVFNIASLLNKIMWCFKYF